MADLPENPVPEQAPPIQPIASSSLNPAQPSDPQSAHHGGAVNRTSSAPINRDNGRDSLEGSTADQAEAPDNAIPVSLVNGTNGGHDNNDMEGRDAKDIQFPLPPTRHENTPEPSFAQQLHAMANSAANNGDTATLQHPGPNTDGSNGGEEQAGPPAAPDHEQQNLGGQPGNAAATQGSTSNQSGLDTIDENGEDGNGVVEEDDNDEEDEEGANNANTSTGFPPGPRGPPGPGPQPPPSQGGSTGQTSGSGNRNSHPPNQSLSANPSSGSQASAQGQARTRSHNSNDQETSSNILPSTRASDWDAGITIAGADANEGSVQNPSREASYLDRTAPTRASSSGQAPPASPQQSSSSPMHPVASNPVLRSSQPAISQEFALPRWQPDSEVNECPICGTQFSIFYRRHHCR